MGIVLVFIILIFLSAFFSSAEIAFFSLSDATVRTMVAKKNKNARLVHKLKRRPQKLLIMILIGNNIVNVLTASIAAVMAVDFFGSAGVGIATSVVTLGILVFGEIVPKSFAQHNNRLICQISAPVVYFLYVIFYPLIFILYWFNRIFIFIFSGKVEDDNIEDEIKSLARIGVEKGHLEYREKEMLDKVFAYHDLRIADIMIPRYKMILLNGLVPISKIAYFVSQASFSRYPVYEKNDDNIIGYIHIKDVLKYLNSDDRDLPLKDIVRPISTVSEESKVEAVFRKMRRTQEHLTLVYRRHEKDNIIGMVTLEDVLEEIVGEIADELDI